MRSPHIWLHQNYGLRFNLVQHIQTPNLLNKIEIEIIKVEMNWNNFLSLIIVIELDFVHSKSPTNMPCYLFPWIKSCLHDSDFTDLDISVDMSKLTCLCSSSYCYLLNNYLAGGDVTFLRRQTGSSFKIHELIV